MGFDKPQVSSADVKCDFLYIVYIGRLDRRKGYKELIVNFRYYKKIYNGDLKLILIGSGGDKKDVTNNDIIFTGFISDEEKLSYLHNSEALVIPSRYESLSMVTLEAMSIGKLVLATGKSEVLKDHMQNSNAGFLYSNQTEFVSELNKILNLSDTEKKEMANRAISYVNNNYSWPTIISKLDKAINYISDTKKDS